MTRRFADDPDAWPESKGVPMSGGHTEDPSETREEIVNEPDGPYHDQLLADAEEAYTMNESKEEIVNEPYALSKGDVLRYIEENMSVKDLLVLAAEKACEANPDARRLDADYEYVSTCYGMKNISFVVSVT